MEKVTESLEGSDKMINEMVDFIGEFEIDPLCNKIVAVCQNLVPCESCAIFLRDEKREGFPDTITIKAGAGFSEKLVEEPARYKIGEKGITAYAARTGEIVNCENKEEIHNHPNYEGRYEEAQGYKCTSLLIVPIKINGEILGILKVENKKSTKEHPDFFFTKEEEESLKPFANGVARAIDGIAKLNEERKTRAGEIATALEGITSLLAEKFNLDDLFKEVVEQTKGLLSAGSCSIFRVNEKTKGSMTMKAGAGFSEKLVVKKITYDKDGEGITASILRNKEKLNLKTREEIINYRDPKTNEKVWAGKAEKLQNKECYSYLGIPLMIRKEIVGVLRVENKRSKKSPEKYFTGHDEKILQIMANDIVLAIKLKGELEESEQRLGKTYEELFGTKLLECLKELEETIKSQMELQNKGGEKEKK